jgi:hypothetical protein
MLIPTQVTFRGLAHSDATEADILERVAWLEQFYQGIVSCRVLVELPNRHRRDGRHFHITVELTVPSGPPIIVSREPSLHGLLKDAGATEHQKDSETDSTHQYAHVAVHEAFDAARRRLQDFARRQRDAVKTHEAPAHGVISRIWPDKDYGYIQADNHELYFHRASVVGEAFETLAT